MITSYSVEGRYWQDIASDFSYRKDKLCLLSLSGEGNPSWKDQNSHVTFSTKMKENASVSKRIVGIVREISAFRPDVIQTHLFLAAIVGLISGKLFNIPVVVTRHHIDEHIQNGTMIHRFADRMTIKFATRVIVRSAAAKSWLVMNEGGSDEKIDVVNQGFDFKFLEPTIEQISACKSELFFGKNEFNIVCVARYSKSKGQNFLIEAVAQIQEEIPNIHVTFMGPGDPHWLILIADSNKVLHFCSFEGERTDVPACLAAADLVVHPSLADSFSQLIIEAQAVGATVIASDIAAVRDQIIDGITGLIVPPRDSKAIAENIKYLYLNPEFRKHMGLSAKSHVREKFPVKKMNDLDSLSLKIAIEEFWNRRKASK